MALKNVLIVGMVAVGSASLCEAKVDCMKELDRKLTSNELQGLLANCPKNKPEIDFRLNKARYTEKKAEENKQAFLRTAPPLLHAVASGDRPAVVRMLQQGSSPDWRLPSAQVYLSVTILGTKGFKGSMTALMVAASLADAEMVKTLLDAKADVNAKDEGGNTALLHALGATPVQRQPTSRPTQDQIALQRLAGMLQQNGLLAPLEVTSIVEMLIAAGTDVNARNANGIGPLEAASADLVELLKKAGAKPSAEVKPDSSRAQVKLRIVNGQGQTVTSAHLQPDNFYILKDTAYCAVTSVGGSGGEYTLTFETSCGATPDNVAVQLVDRKTGAPLVVKDFHGKIVPYRIVLLK